MELRLSVLIYLRSEAESGLNVLKLRWWQKRTQCCGHIVARDCFYAALTGKHSLQTQNVSERNQKHFCVSDTNFVSATNVARAGKRGNICVHNNVSATLCLRLPPSLRVISLGWAADCDVVHSVSCNKKTTLLMLKHLLPSIELIAL